ncbi:RNA-binding S4 domain-containing protein [Neorhizobium lilium]|uniref:RNA-binding S4 domain-containing protein n=1 Tax=Neorhizobium lilium TaxID=2503024 RepID=A0A3S3RGC9_9HYPH|nr:RNA-binding S4 domain-containing protein [Neorhizobium lilium]RWX75068.1 RNA-binding S4 domain-containing protein [Neorhizobium lilium]
MDEKQPHPNARQRIDKWLFFTRMAKSRSIAQALVNSNNVRVNGELVPRPSFEVKPGDKVSLKLERRDLVLVVKAGGERRGPFEEARLLYDDLTPPPEEVKKLSLFEQAQRQPGSGRPTKKDRRAVDRLFGDFSDDAD